MGGVWMEKNGKGWVGYTIPEIWAECARYLFVLPNFDLFGIHEGFWIYRRSEAQAGDLESLCFKHWDI
jgi:hypothetical protein